MAKKEEMKRLPRPELPSPLNMPTGGKVHVVVKGRGIVKSDKPEVSIERKE